MTEKKRKTGEAAEAEKKARAYADNIPAEEDESPEEEAVYRDGSARNECWNDSEWR